MPKYRKKAVVVEAHQLSSPLRILTEEGVLLGNAGDWLITGIEGEQYPVKDSVFQKTYEKVEGDTP